MKVLTFFALIVISSTFITTCSAQENYKYKDANYNYKNDHFYEVKNYDQSKIKFKKYPKNIILIIGDGMGLAQVYAGLTANNGNLFLQNFKHIGFSKTYSADNYITDSAAGGTALSSGYKTYNGAIGLDTTRTPHKTILEIAEDHQKATGLVATSAITHATPASFIAHQPSRKMYEEIATDFLKTDIDVFIGGGADFFNKRKDGRNLSDELIQKNYQVLYNLKDASNINSGKLAVLTAPEHNDNFEKRGNMLETASQKAIEILSKDNNGFFLMIEGSQIDWGGHQNNTGYAVGEMLDLDKTIGKVLEFAVNNKETLVIVTADHETGGMAILDGNPAEGIVNGGFITQHHTGIMVPVYAFGPGAEEFMGIYENTEIFHKMYNLFKFNK